MKPIHYLTAIATVLASSAAEGLVPLSAQAENQSSEMRELVRQSQGLKPSDGSADKKITEALKNQDPAAIYIEAGASTEQANKIRELRKNLEKYQQTKMSEIIVLYKEMHDLTVKPELDEAKIIAAQEKLNALQSEVAMQKTKTLINVRKLLTVKQRESLAAIIQKRSARLPQQPH